jgi:hypothetical protein
VKIICSWCQGTIAEGPAEPKLEVSHGMCPRCLVEMLTMHVGAAQQMETPAAAVEIAHEVKP